MKNIAILGSTGSIGKQALNVIENLPDKLHPYVLTANNNYELLIEQALKFSPEYVVITNENHYKKVLEALKDTRTKVLAGASALSEVVKLPEVDIVLTALVGFSGFSPTIEAIKKGKIIALANKETLVVGGEIINNLLRVSSSEIIPVDSEHSAIYQVLVGEEKEAIEKIILTASGGPFRGRKRKDLQNVSVEEALNHPNWKMGSKITIDSATLMNKALEVIEAKWLFDVSPSQIDVVIHPQSIVHSMVQFVDGSVKAQLGTPDMRIPIQYALGETRRFANDFPRYNFVNGSLTFETPDNETFPSLLYAYECLNKGGNSACILNAANEIAVGKFLRGEIKFLQIYEIIEKALAKIPFVKEISEEILTETDKETRDFCKGL